MNKWKYKEIAVGNSRRKNGMVLEHRYIAEQIIGRPLTSLEVVHHIDNDRTNNKPENIMVFASQSDHARFHKGGIAKARADKVFECKFDHPIKQCLQCGKETTNYAFCSSACAGKSRRKVQRPSKEELANMISRYSWLALGREYGVSDNAVRKWAKAYDLL